MVMTVVTILIREKVKTQYVILVQRKDILRTHVRGYMLSLIDLLLHI